MSTAPKPVVRADGQPGSGGFALTLDVRDPEVIAELDRREPGEREIWALGALRVGVLALRQASGALDTAAIREAAEHMLDGVRATFDQRGKIITDAIRQYFDPKDGELPRRLEALLKSDGDLDRALRSHLAGENSTVARTLATQIGEGSPLLKLLSPTDALGVRAQIETTVNNALSAQRDAILREFSLDRKDSALARTVGELLEKNGSLRDDLKAQVSALTDEFSLNKSDSALSRLIGRMEEGKEKESRELRDALGELRELLTRLQVGQEAAAASTLHGNTFEESVGSLLQREAQALNDRYEAVGDTAGAISRCKVGDHLITFGAECAAPGTRVVCEAKSNKSYSLQNALDELDQARKNRQAQFGIFIFDRAAAPEGLAALQRYGCDLVIIWDPQDRLSDIYPRVALSVTRALAVRAAQQTAETGEALDKIGTAIVHIEKAIADLADIETWSQTVRNNGEKIAQKTGKLRDALQAEVETLARQLSGLKAASPPSAA